MTVEEYIANPESWEPTFICSTPAELNAWITNAVGNNYERVKIIGNITGTSAGPDVSLTNRLTKQVVFENNAKITIPSVTKGFSYDTLPDSDEYWMFSPNITVPAVVTFMFKNCKNLINLSLTMTLSGSGAFYYTESGFENCENIKIKSATTLNPGSSTNLGYPFAFFRNCKYISAVDDLSTVDIGGFRVDNNAVIKNCGFLNSQFINLPSVTVRAMLVSTTVTTNAAGIEYGFINCKNVNIGTVMFYGGATIAGTGGGTSWGNRVFSECEDVSVNTATIQLGTVATGGIQRTYCFASCKRVSVGTFRMLKDPSDSTSSNATFKGLGACFCESEDCEAQVITYNAEILASPSNLHFAESSNRVFLGTCSITVSGNSSSSSFSAILSCKNITIENLSISGGFTEIVGILTSTNVKVLNAQIQNTFNTANNTYGAKNVQDIQFVESLNVATSYGASTYGIYNCSIVQGQDEDVITAATKIYQNDWLSELKCIPALPVVGELMRMRWDFLNKAGEHIVKTATIAASYDNGASWFNLYTGTNKEFGITPPTESIIVRVTDTETYKIEGAPQELVRSPPPIISGVDEDIGDFVDSFTPYGYTISKSATDEEDWSEVIVTESVDGVVINSFQASIGVEYFCNLLGQDWTKIRNGGHTLTISATKSFGGRAVRSLSFEKMEDTIRFSRQSPQAAVSRPVSIRPNLMFGAIPADAEITVEACNNGLDDSPTWEDVTENYLASTEYTFSNETKTNVIWGVNIRVTVRRGAVPVTTPINVIEMSAGWDY